jgi:predicted amidophosphoribosyltransferase
MKIRYVCSSPDCNRSFLGSYHEKNCDRCGSAMLDACPHCNNQLKSDLPFCRVCAQRIKPEPAQQPAQ